MLKPTSENMQADTAQSRVRKRLRKRYQAERRFKFYGFCAVVISIFFLCILLNSIISKSFPAFTYYFLSLPLEYNEDVLALDGRRDEKSLRGAKYKKVLRNSIYADFPEVSGRTPKRDLMKLISGGAEDQIRQIIMADPDQIGKAMDTQVMVSDDVDMYLKGHMTDVKRTQLHDQIEIKIDGKRIELYADKPVFEDDIESYKAFLRNQIDKVEAHIVNEQRKVDYLQDVLAETGQQNVSDEAKSELADLQSELDDSQAKLTLLLDQRQGFENQLAGEISNVPMGADNESLLIHIEGGFYRVVTLSADKVSMEPIYERQPLSPQTYQTWQKYSVVTPEKSRKINDRQIAWIEILNSEGRLEEKFNTTFFTAGASREPELAGIYGALVGSFYTMLVTFIVAFPIGVGAAIYLEEFAPKNRLTDMIEVNINNLAAVPSIVFGLLGLGIFINFFEAPRSAPITGGLVLALMTLPTIIIAARAALRSVPPSIREAALGIGASKIQTVFHHVLPLSMSGILTGTIISMAQALGETAPLLMIGMVAFIVDVPTSFTDAATVLPVQIFMWYDFPEPAFKSRAAAAIVVLLFFLVLMNLIAVLLRNRFERRW